MDENDHIAPPPYAMDTFEVSITAEKFTGVRRAPGDYEATVITQGLPDRVTVTLPREQPKLDPEGHPTDGLPVANCRDCHEPLDGDGESRQSERVCPVTGTEHVPVPLPLSWANHAAIHLDHDQDRISVGISVADPRGGFSLEIRRERVTDPCPNATCMLEIDGESEAVYVDALNGGRCPGCGGTGGVNPRYELRMSLPHHADGWLHAPLTDLNGHNYYKIGY